MPHRKLPYILVILCLTIAPASVFAQTLTITPQTQGLVFTEDDNIQCGTDNRYGSSLSEAITERRDCSHNYSGGAITLIARPNHPNVFVGWLGDCQGNDSRLTITVSANRTCQAVFTKPSGYVQVSAVAGNGNAANRFICAVTSAGRIDCWGGNRSGQLSTGDTDPRNVPTPVVGIANVITEAIGTSNICALLRNGQVQCWGNGDDGRLGNGDTRDRRTPTPVVGINNAIVLATSDRHVCAILANGQLWCWGDNGAGQLGVGDKTDRHTPVAAMGISNVISVGVGQGHTCAVPADGTVKCWGFNDHGRLGIAGSIDQTLPTTVTGITNVVAVSSGFSHNCALLTGGKVRCWGSNDSGQLGDGTSGNNKFTPVEVMGISNAVSVSASLFSCALLSTGQVQCWGNGANGRLGTGNTQNSNIPVDVVGISNAANITAGRSTTCALLRNGTLYCWGSDADGQIGNGAPTDASGYATPQLVANQVFTSATSQRFVTPGMPFVFQPKIVASTSTSTWSVSPSVSSGLRFLDCCGTVYGTAPSRASYTLTATTASGDVPITLTLSPPPSASTLRITDSDPSANTVPENSTLSTPINGVRLQIMQGDTAIPTQSASWSVSSDMEAFRINANATLHTNALIDYETTPQLTLTIAASLLETNTTLSPLTLTVAVANVVESITVSDVLSANNNIRANADPNEPVGGIRLIAKEGSRTITTGLTWSLTGNAAFAIDSNSGIIRFDGSPPITANSSVTVAATANVGTISSDAFSVTINITPNATLLKLHIKTFLEGPLQ